MVELLESALDIISAHGWLLGCVRRPEIMLTAIATTRVSSPRDHSGSAMASQRVDHLRVTKLRSDPRDDDTPTSVILRVDVVDLEGHDRVVRSQAEVSIAASAEHDLLVDETERHGQHDRQCVGRHRDSTEGRQREQAKALGLVEHLEPAAVRVRGRHLSRLAHRK